MPDEDHKAKIKTFVQENWKFCLSVCLCIVFFAVAVTVYMHKEEKRDTRPAIVKYDDSTDSDKISKQIDVSPAAAKEITHEIERIHDGKAAPSASYYIEAPTIEKAAEEMAAAIEKKDPDLPAAAVAKSDRTVVTPDPVKQKVDVYKIDLKDNHKIKAGVLSAEGKPYFGVGYQAGRVEGMLYTRTGRTIDAASLTYTIKHW
jgi:type IV secretory pathway VirB10-like protein